MTAFSCRSASGGSPGGGAGRGRGVDAAGERPLYPPQLMRFQLVQRPAPPPPPNLGSGTNISSYKKIKKEK